MKTQPITKKQKEILNYLYKFRFLNTHQIKNLLEHKNPNRSLSWLKDLIEKGYVKRSYERKSFVDNTKPAIYYLAPKARRILIDTKTLDTEDLEYIYQEHRREKKFINHCLFIADTYLYLLSQKASNEELKFFTKNDLRRYDYFPNPLPDGFIAVKTPDTTRRYFFDFFDDNTPPFVIRSRVKMYLNYADNSDWDDNTDNTPLPAILFVCANKSIKKHIMIYAKALLEKSFEDKISLFITTKNEIIWGNKDIWEKVSTFEE